MGLDLLDRALVTSLPPLASIFFHELEGRDLLFLLGLQLLVIDLPFAIADLAFGLRVAHHFLLLHLLLQDLDDALLELQLSLHAGRPRLSLLVAPSASLSSFCVSWCCSKHFDHHLV